MTRLALAIAFPLLAALLPGAARGASQDDGGTLSVTVENDVVSGRDRHYTNGLRLAYVTAPKQPTAFERLIGGKRTTEGLFRRSFAVAQSIYTPEHYLAETPPADDHPYAGHLFGEYALLTETDGRFDLITIEVGVVGPWARGEEVQNWFHRTIDVYEAVGWEHQIGNEVTVNLAYDWKGKPVAEGKAAGLQWELMPTAGASLGTVAVNARAGGMFRIGDRLTPNFGPARIRPSLTGSGHFDRANPFDWFAFIGVQGRIVGHDIFLDGSLFQADSPSTDKSLFVGDVQGGAAVTWGAAQLSLTYVHRTERYLAQDGADGFGALTLSFKF